jgi:molybdopterin converting factor small subunit
VIWLTVRYFAAARAAAGVDAEELGLPLRTAWTVDDVLRELAERHGPALAKVLGACSFLLDEVAVRSRDTVVPRSGAVLDILPPFAGG